MRKSAVAQETAEMQVCFHAKLVIIKLCFFTCTPASASNPPNGPGAGPWRSVPAEDVRGVCSLERVT